MSIVRTIIILLLVIGTATINISHAQTNYTWTGIHSSNWNDSLNWTPKGIPSANDNITIDAQNNSLVLDQNRTINNAILQNIYLNLKGYSFSINGTANFSAIQITPGSLNFTSSVLTLDQVTTKASIHAVATSITLQNSQFDSTVYLERTGNNTNDFFGPNIFNKTATLIQNNSGSTWNIGQGNLPEVFNGDVDFIAQSGSIQVASTSACLFRGNISLSSSGQGISIGDTSLNFQINNSLMSVGKAINTSGFSSGKLSLYKIIQQGTGANNLQLTGNATFTASGCDFGGDVSVSTTGTDTTVSTVNIVNTMFRQSTSISAPLATLQGNHFNVNNSTGSQTTILQSAMGNESQIQNTNLISGTFTTKQ